jgi:hypothetical protein
MPSHAFPLLAILLLFSSPTLLSAQAPLETAGTRALGMGGAFVGVADDSSAPYWNPAGLSTLRFFDASLERTEVGWVDTTQFAVALPVLAFSYTRQHFEDPDVSIAELTASRQDRRIETVARTFRVQHFGLTLVQSLGDAVVVGSTLRLVRGGAGEARNRFDADIGVLATIGRLRLGLAVRNLTEPEFDAGSTRPWEIERHARIGASFGGEPARGQRPWAAAVDADLTRTAVPGGERRSLAAGAERWSANRRFALRGGGRVQTVGDLRPAASGGASVAIRSGVLIETQATGGSDAADRGWSVAARLTF